MNSGPQRDRWRAAMLLASPHRLGFFAAMVVLASSALWWAAVQLQRQGVLAPAAQAIPSTLVHAAAMSFGFLPLFFTGVLFTAGPRWLGVRAPATPSLAAPIAMQVVGWLLWLAASSMSAPAAVAGLALATGGFSRIAYMFGSLVSTSRAADRLHARAVLAALFAGCAALAATTVTTALGDFDVAVTCVRSGLWASSVAAFLTVAHRMVPFFTVSAATFESFWHDTAILVLMLVVAALEAADPWVGLGRSEQVRLWAPLAGTVELACGAILLAVAATWGFAINFKLRMLTMLHAGFAWLGMALAIGGASRWLGWLDGAPVLPLAGLHAVTIGCLGSLMLAMVTRVSCGRSGRTTVADDFTWLLFWLLQAAALLRIAGAAPSPAAQPLLTAAAVAWAVVAVAWGVRHGSWYGRPRADGRPG